MYTAIELLEPLADLAAMVITVSLPLILNILVITRRRVPKPVLWLGAGAYLVAAGYLLNDIRLMVGATL